MTVRLTIIATTFFLLLVQNPARGHHSFAVEFTAEEIATIQGVVTKVWFRNPHVRYFVEVTDNETLTQTIDKIIDLVQSDEVIINTHDFEGK